MSTDRSLPHSLDRTVIIAAPPALVFRYFTDAGRWAQWWGAGSTIDPRPGGALLIRHPDGTEVAGEVLQIEPPALLVFSQSYRTGPFAGAPSSVVTIRLAPDGKGTRLHLQHDFAEPSARDLHVQGWRYQLSLFANIATTELHAGAAARIDEWFAVWSEPDATVRRRRLAAIADEEVRFRDRFSTVAGLDDLNAQLTAVQHFMPGTRIERDGTVEQCQGTALCEWRAFGADGQPRGRGRNVFELGADGLIRVATGFWAG